MIRPLIIISIIFGIFIVGNVYGYGVLIGFVWIPYHRNIHSFAAVQSFDMGFIKSVFACFCIVSESDREVGCIGCTDVCYCGGDRHILLQITEIVRTKTTGYLDCCNS